MAINPYLKPTLETKFHIDMEWWERNRLDFRLYLRNQLCPECRERFPTHQHTESVDWVDPETAEVRRTDALWQCLRTYCAGQPEYINEHLPLTAAVFRVFLANDNTPLSPLELHQIITWRSPETILRALGGRQIYLGIRPVSNSRH
ncbi:MAG TPA: hypothetical protein EYH31_04050 [Anaerolineae bacterium]|nr:hypothetical protein [Anaerolineae bacterium]